MELSDDKCYWLKSDDTSVPHMVSTLLTTLNLCEYYLVSQNLLDKLLAWGQFASAARTAQERADSWYTSGILIICPVPGRNVLCCVFNHDWWNPSAFLLLRLLSYWESVIKMDLPDLMSKLQDLWCSYYWQTLTDAWRRCSSKNWWNTANSIVSVNQNVRDKCTHLAHNVTNHESSFQEDVNCSIGSIHYRTLYSTVYFTILNTGSNIFFLFLVKITCIVLALRRFANMREAFFYIFTQNQN